MNRAKYNIYDVLGRLRIEHPDRSPYIFGHGFERSGYKTFNADQETVIPGAMCINSHVLNILSDPKTLFHIEKYMEQYGRSAEVTPDVNRTTAIVLMLSCINYSFHKGTFPYCDNASVNQMWADVERMAYCDHVACAIIAMATRGRGHAGFAVQRSPRQPLLLVEQTPVPKSPPPPPPPPPPRNAPPSASAESLPPPRVKTPQQSSPKSYASAVDEHAPK